MRRFLKARRMRRFLIVLTILFEALIMIFHPSRVFPESRPPYKIYMIYWRGQTDGERGFMKYFYDKKIPVDFIIRDCNNDKNKLPGFVSEIKEMKPDLVYVFGTTAALGIFGSKDTHPGDKYVTDIPGVFNIVSVPVESNLVENLRSSGRNITGTIHIAPVETQLNAIKSVFNVKKMGVAYNPQEKNSVILLRKLEALGKEQGFIVVSSPFKLKKDKNPDKDSIPETLDKLISLNPELVYFPSDSFLVSNAKEVVDILSAHKIPVFSATEAPIIEGGALMGLVCHYYNVGQYSAYKAEQILVNGKKPSEIPIDSLNRFSFLFNLSASRKLDLYPPFNLLEFVEIIK
jgi:putative ABC transport system substrate-binding protein